MEKLFIDGKKFVPPEGVQPTFESVEIEEDLATAMAKAVQNNPDSPLLDMSFGRLHWIK